jgi:uncharacterized protein with ACT and thioredoxin-like domain
VPLVTRVSMVFQVRAVALVPAVEALVVAGVPVVAQVAAEVEQCLLRPSWSLTGRAST